MQDNQKTKDRSNNQSRLLLVAVVGCLVLLAVASRFVLVDWPNFKPVGAIAVFIGFLVRDRKWALISVLTIMLLSDSLLGFYELPLMIAVYGSMLLACCIGFGLQVWLQNSESVVVRTMSITGATISGSILFFVFSNVAVCFAGWYPINLNGAAQALAAGIPFFRFTLAGDLCFTLLLFSTYYAVMNRSYSWKPGTNACHNGSRNISASGS